MRKLVIFISIFVFLSSFFGCKSQETEKQVNSWDRDTLYQTSIYKALSEGVFTGDKTILEIQRYGDFGLGTFNDLDGEMIAFDGQFYQIDEKAQAFQASEDVKCPYAIVTFFDPDSNVQINEPLDFNQFQEFLLSSLPTENLFFAIKVKGLFPYIKIRSIPAQTKPYLKLNEVLENQPTFEFQDVKGTLVGFFVPTYITDINTPGFHFHFLTEDKSSGGHLLTCQVESADVEIDQISKYHIELIQSEDFYKIDLQ